MILCVDTGANEPPVGAVVPHVHLHDLAAAHHEAIDMAVAIERRVTIEPAKLMNLKDYGIAVGNPADLIVLDCQDPAKAIAQIAHPLLGLKRGRRSFARAAPMLCPPV